MQGLELLRSGEHNWVPGSQERYVNYRCHVDVASRRFCCLLITVAKNLDPDLTSGLI